MLERMPRAPSRGGRFTQGERGVPAPDATGLDRVGGASRRTTFRLRVAGYKPPMTAAPRPTTARTPELVDFGPLRIAYDERVLRPRSWTTAQSAWAAEVMADAPAGPVLELCAGAGQIGLLAVLGSDRRLVCVDVSPVACSYARANAESAGLSGRVEVREGPMDVVLAADERFAVVVADPPWVPAHEISCFPEDPELAIDGGPDGLDVARTCLTVAAHHLEPGGVLLLQVGTLEQAELLRRERDELELTEVRQEERGVLARFDRA